MTPITAYSRKEQRMKAWLVPSRTEAIAHADNTWGRSINPFERPVLGCIPMLWTQVPVDEATKAETPLGD